MNLGNIQESLTQALVLAFFDAGGFLTTAPETPVVSWNVSGAATVAPSADGLSAVITPSAPGAITVGVTVTGANGFSASDSAVLTSISGAPVTVQIQLAPVAAAPASAPVSTPAVSAAAPASAS